jgi:hypothetical protein
MVPKITKINPMKILILLLLPLSLFSQTMTLRYDHTELPIINRPRQPLDTASFIANIPHYCTLQEAIRKIKNPIEGQLIAIGEADTWYIYVNRNNRKWQKIKR